MHEQWFNLWLYQWHSLLPVDNRSVVTHHVKFAAIHRILFILSHILYADNLTIIYAAYSIFHNLHYVIEGIMMELNCTIAFYGITVMRIRQLCVSFLLFLL